MGAARDLEQLPPIIPGARWAVDFEHYGADESTPEDYDGWTASLTLAPLKQAQPAAEDVHTLVADPVDAHAFGARLADDDHDTWTPGLYVAVLRLVDPAEGAEVSYVGVTQVWRGPWDVAASGGGNAPLPGAAPARVQIFRDSDTVRIVRGVGGAAGKSAKQILIAGGHLPAGTTDAEFATWLTSNSEAAAASAQAAADSAEAASTSETNAAASEDNAAMSETAAALAASAAEGDAQATAADRAAVEAISAQVGDLAVAVATATDAADTATDKADEAAASAAGVNFAGQVDASAMLLDLFGLVDAALRKALSLGGDGTVYVGKAEVFRLLVDELRAGGVQVLTKALAAAGELAALDGTSAELGVADVAGRLGLRISPDGVLDARFDGVLPYLGGRLAASAGHLVEARPRARSYHGFHDLYAIDLATGAEVALTSDAADLADHLNPAIVGAHCHFTRRIGRRAVRRAVPLTGGADVPAIPERSLHMLGDSFVTTGLRTAVLAALDDTARAFTQDGVGGSTLAEQAARFELTPQHWDRTLIIMDGGLSDADPVARIAAIVAHLTPALPRWIYVQGGVSRTSSPAAVAAKLATDAAIEAAYPQNYCETYDYLRANGTGSTIGSGGGEVWPTDCYGDDIHPSTQGETLIGAAIAQFLNTKGW